MIENEMNGCITTPPATSKLKIIPEF